MPIYTDKKSGTLFVKFDYEGIAYKKRLPRGTTKREAAKYEATWKTGLYSKRNGREEICQIKFEDFLVKYFLPYSEANKKSFERDVIVCKFALNFFRGKNLRDIKPLDIEDFKVKRMNTPTQHDTPRKPATVVRELSVISKVFSLALNSDYVEYNPCQRVEKPKFHNVGRSKLKDGDDEKFFAAFESDWAADICRLIMNTGLRQCDATGLLWEEIDWEANEIRLIQKKTGREVLIPLNESAKQILQKRLAKRSCELVFPSPKSGARGFSVKTAVKGAVERSKISRVTVRDLRRTAASRLLDAGADHITIASILGHTDLRMIQRYAQSDKAKREAVELLDEQNRAKIVPISEIEKAPTTVSA
jgi:integrase